MADEIHQSDIGVILQFTVQEAGTAVNISTASTKTIKLVKPDDSVLSKAGSFTTDGSDGKLQYTTVSGDLDTAGTWHAQLYLVMTGWTGHTSIVPFVVYPNVS